MLASRLRVNGRKRRFSNTMMSFIFNYYHNACSVRDVIVFPLFTVSVWAGEKDSNKLRVDAFFFLKREGKISAFKNIWIRVDGA